MEITAFDLAQRFVGMKEAPGEASNPAVLAMLRLDNATAAGDDIPWCSAFVNYITWLLRLPRSHSHAARSWLTIGRPVETKYGLVGFDVVVLKRGDGEQPGPEVIEAPGHVGFFAAFQGDTIMVLGGNQKDSVSVAQFPTSRVLGVRRLA